MLRSYGKDANYKGRLCRAGFGADRASPAVESGIGLRPARPRPQRVEPSLDVGIRTEVEADHLTHGHERAAEIIGDAESAGDPRAIADHMLVEHPQPRVGAPAMPVEQLPRL